MITIVCKCRRKEEVNFGAETTTFTNPPKCDLCDGNGFLEIDEKEIIKVMGRSFFKLLDSSSNSRGV